MTDLDLLQQYAEAVKESTNRTRRILLIMIVASILVLSAFWNTRPEGWVNSRLQRAKATDESFGLNKTDPSPALFWIQKIRTEQVSQVQVPVLGISFDVNDLGLLGGVTFSVLLIWVNYSLWHHSNNLKLAFGFARHLDEKNSEASRFLFHTYQNLAMRQVLTIPPRPYSTKRLPSSVKALDTESGIGLDSKSGDKKDAGDEEPMYDKASITVRWLRKGSKLLYGLPFLAQAIVFINDLRTWPIGYMLNPLATKVVLIAGGLSLVIVAILTVTCYILWIKAHDTWWQVAREI